MYRQPNWFRAQKKLNGKYFYSKSTLTFLAMQFKIKLQNNVPLLSNAVFVNKCDFRLVHYKNVFTHFHLKKHNYMIMYTCLYYIKILIKILLRSLLAFFEEFSASSNQIFSFSVCFLLFIFCQGSLQHILFKCLNSSCSGLCSLA